MNRIEELKSIFLESKLSEIFDIRKEDDYPDKEFSALRFQPNDYRIRAIEIWEHKNGRFFRIYYGSQIPRKIKSEISAINGGFKELTRHSDFRGDYTAIASTLFNILSSKSAIEAAMQNPVLTKNSAYEGLTLPDIDTSDNEVLGVAFTWREIIAISEDISEDNHLKKELSKSGVYLQRSSDGKARYVGSAYSDGGILARWLKHLNSNGDAKHLNLYVLENGYANMEFTVLEFTSAEDATKHESRWKNTLSTKNSGPYDGFCLNNN